MFQIKYQMRQTNCKHPKGLLKGYPFDLHSQIRNPNMVSIKGGGRILWGREKKGEIAKKEKNPKKLDGYCSEKTLVIFHRKSRLLLHQRLTKRKSSWEQEICIEAETSEEQASKVRILVDFFEATGLFAF